MAEGSAALHPFAILVGESMGLDVRWSFNTGPDPAGVLVLADPGPDMPATLILGCNDHDGDTTALRLAAPTVRGVRDALSAWLDEQDAEPGS